MPQLWGRLQDYSELEIQKLLTDGQKSKSKDIWLRPQTVSFINPDSPLLRTLSGHSSVVDGVAITPDGKKAVSASSDNTLKVWNLETGKEIVTFIGDSIISCCAIAPDGLTIVAGESSGRIHFLRLEGEELSQKSKVKM